MKTLIESIGWYGMLALVGAYACVSFSILSPDDILYQLLNGSGAIGIVIVSFYKKAWQPGILNCIWAGIALVALLQLVV